jgi:GNAT superfamily N-acetyltransferase
MNVIVVAADIDAVVSFGLLDELDRELEDRYPGEPVNRIDPRDFRASGGFFVVACVESALAACGAFRPLSATTLEIKRMFVRPSYRGRGVARPILGALEAEATARGFGVAVLETGTGQPEAIALYHSCRYEDIEPFGPYDGRVHSVCMRKALRPH